MGLGLCCHVVGRPLAFHCETAGSQGLRGAAGCVDPNSDGPGAPRCTPTCRRYCLRLGAACSRLWSLAEEETHPVDLSSLSSKLLPGFTTLGFREERRSRGETPPPSTQRLLCQAWLWVPSCSGVPGGAGAGAQRAGPASASARVRAPPCARRLSAWWSSDAT